MNICIWGFSLTHSVISKLMSHKSLYKFFLISTLLCFFSLIIAGSVVRATGSGLGCPDWPKCFGQYIPPIYESELPENYQEIFKIQGKTIAPFSAFKTWIEYLNRLLGALAGILVLGVLVFSYRLKYESYVSFKNSLMLFILVGLQGYLGSLVVSSLLAPYMITLHLILAIIVTCLCAELNFKMLMPRIPKLYLNNKIKKYYFFAGILALGQFILGTRIREKVDKWMHEEMNEVLSLPRQDWFSNLGPMIDIHRISAIFIITILLIIMREIRKANLKNKFEQTLPLIPLGLLASSYLSGIFFKHLNFPGWNQPIHLFLASLLIVSFYIINRLYFNKN